MQLPAYPVIDLAATGANILRLRKSRGLTVKQLQTYFGFEEPQAIYKWQWGRSLPTVDNLYALSVLLEVPVEQILVPVATQPNTTAKEQQAVACCSAAMCTFWIDRLFVIRQRFPSWRIILPQGNRTAPFAKAEVGVPSRWSLTGDLAALPKVLDTAPPALSVPSTDIGVVSLYYLEQFAEKTAGFQGVFQATGDFRTMLWKTTAPASA